MVLLCICCQSWAQGPQASYYYNPSTELPWAQCYVYLEGGSHQKIPFLSAVSYDHSPSGTLSYTKNIRINGAIVFVGDGIVSDSGWNSYSGRRDDYSIGEIVIKGKIALLCYDFPDSIETRFGDAYPLKRRIATAVAQRASAIVLFSHRKPYPFLYLDFLMDSAMSATPIITITESSVTAILECAGINGGDLLKEWEKTGHPPESRELISKLNLSVRGTFQTIGTPHYFFKFRREEFSERRMHQIASVNEKAHLFITHLFKGVDLASKRSFIVYFRDYDSKVFYTHHWGKGFASNAGIFNVHEGEVPNFGLAVHENTHQLWGANSTSFLNEGIAMYAEALATDKNKNNRQTLEFMKKEQLYPLEEMMQFHIGTPGPKTVVGYPASGAFVDFLIESYGLRQFHDVFLLEGRPGEESTRDDSWKKIYSKSVSDLEEQWHQWLLHGSRLKQ
jgi:hypothetical protein